MENIAHPLGDFVNQSQFIPAASTSPPLGGSFAGITHEIEVSTTPTLERPGSPFSDEDQCVSKKVRNREKVVDRMEEDHNGMEIQSNEHIIGEEVRQQEKQSYANAVIGQTMNTVDVVSLQAMDEVVVLDGECIVDNNGSYPVIQFADQVHNIINHSMRRSVIIRLLGRAIGYKTLLNRIGLLWQLQGQYQVINLENEYFLVKFECEQDYIHVLTERPWTIFGSYLTIQPWSRTFSTMEKHPSQVVKIDYSTNSGERGRFAPLAVLVNLNKPLVPCLKIDGFWQKIEYEGLQQICFQCGVHGHSKESCGAVEANTSKVGAESGTSAERDQVVGDEEAGFGPWMIAETRRRRMRKNPAIINKVSIADAKGSRFAVLGVENNNFERNSTTITEEVVAETHRKSPQVTTTETRRVGSVNVGNNRTFQQVNVVAMEDGEIHQVTAHCNAFTRGNHAAVIISEDGRNKGTNQNNRTKVNRREVGDSSKGMKNATRRMFSNVHEKRMDEGIPRAVEQSVMVMEEVSLSDSENTNPNIPSNGAGSSNFRLYFREHCRTSRPGVVALLETRISGMTADKAIREKLPNGTWRCLGILGGRKKNYWHDYKVISDCKLSNLTRPLFTEEIRDVLFSMSPLKAPGVDGGEFDNEFNRTLLVLIPKVKAPESFNQFRPISLCSVLYKLVTKIIVHRLKPLMSHWISETQTSFVPDRYFGTVLCRILFSNKRTASKGSAFTLFVRDEHGEATRIFGGASLTYGKMFDKAWLGILAMGVLQEIEVLKNKIVELEATVQRCNERIQQLEGSLPLTNQELGNALCQANDTIHKQHETMEKAMEQASKVAQ
ncbi:hypothetical protein F3Y22_tig00003725pilonHSYRG00018 [Hibiscus syriacus]|uniref:CCHC-type domain-containing protein n=1 Tax=Hibiscus syriacus TaxID=106335 RepID=A0A6A3CNJ5_HIBSY|nr:hypothetical protein F3Y22_tig00003725pilonHSYRG00018 [Hibiscus syriacus]